jgi:monofunctional biosynthetic peptidoglycan transglycosylase
MSERVASQSYAASRTRGRSRRGRRSWLRRLLLLVLGVLFVLPVALILLFRFVPPPVTPLMIATWLSDGALRKRWVPLDAISPNLVRAVIASEDGKFCSHHGFDLEAIDKALVYNAENSRLRGASTISQQTAKNLFLSTNRTWTRKSVEAYLTVLIELMWPKRRIMETYLNIAEWGPARFGAEAAAEANFRKPAAKLSLSEAARLAVILPSPRNYRADRPGPYVVRQSEVIAARVGEVRRDRLDSCIYR